MPNILLILLITVSTSLFAEEDCEHYLKFRDGAVATWDSVTTRASDSVWNSIKEGNLPAHLQGVAGPLAPLDIESVNEGRRSLLSLGEGVSDFIYSILCAQRRRGYPLNAYAVDMIYKDTQAFEDGFIINPSELILIQKYQANFPGRFTGGYFQELNLKDENGHALQFDEIVSSNSLVYVLARFKANNRVAAVETKLRDKATLTAIVKHLKPGGYLRIWPYLINDRGPVTRHQHMKTVLDELVREGFIRNHNLRSAQEQGKHFLIIQR